MYLKSFIALFIALSCIFYLKGLSAVIKKLDINLMDIRLKVLYIVISEKLKFSIAYSLKFHMYGLYIGLTSRITSFRIYKIEL